MSLLDQLLEKLTKKEKRMIEIFKYLHQHPELSFEEENTAQYIADFYQDKDVQVETHIGQGYGVKVTINGEKPGKTLALRADFDALPIQEETNLSYASTVPGVMHACGHDGHTAYMLILAESLIELKDQLPGTIVIIHQPAEELPPGGAKDMVEAGVLEGVDHVIGFHLMSETPVGTVMYCPKEAHSGSAKFVLNVKGKGGHGSSPHTANDAIVAASHFVTAIQTIVSRRLNPFDMGVVTIGSFDGAGVFNIIKDTVTLEGDVRMMKESNRSLIQEQVEQICRGLSEMFGVECQLDFLNDYPVLYNDPTFTHRVAKAIKQARLPQVHEVIQHGPLPLSEDFSYYAKERPSAFLWIGAAPEDETKIYPHHHPQFQINEKSLLVATTSLAAIVADYFS